MIAPICEKLKKSGTGPVVVGGSKNEYASNDCGCEQNYDMFVDKVNHILIGIEGSKKARKVHTLVEVYDKRGKKVYSSKGKKS